MITLAFDVYGTLIDTQGIQATLAEVLGDEQRATAISRRWREKQLEYSFRRGLMEHYQPFSVCIRQALDYVLEEATISLEPDQKETLLAAYRTLPAYPDAHRVLRQLQDSDIRAFAFTNGEAAIASDLLAQAGLIEYLDGLVSVDVLRTFKPSPRVYQHFIEVTDAAPNKTWLVSGNPFDILGARHAGWKTAWVQRNVGLFDPWDETPDVTVSSLSGLSELLSI